MVKIFIRSNHLFVEYEWQRLVPVPKYYLSSTGIEAFN